ncbi:ABC transporter permease [Aestuariivirga sp.]|uniref:ABC transporter permease n=1 Tax=Aestuariivirga sp. TaxID=2650926 RepID=UPI003919FA8C
MRPSIRSSIMLLPAISIFMLFFTAPLAFFFVVSFWRLKSYRLVREFSFSNYLATISDYGEALLFTLVVSAAVAAITTVTGFLIAYFIRFKSGAMGQALLFIVLVTLFGGYLVKIYAWKTLLGTQGILNSALLSLNVVDEPITWSLYSPVAVMITLVNFLIPFAVLPIYGSLRNIEDTPIAAARDLGAGPSRVLFEIIIPQCRAGLFSAFALCFLITAGDYVTPRLVGGTSTFMIGNFIESQFINRLNAPLGAAMSFLTIAASLLVLLVVRQGLRRSLAMR